MATIAENLLTIKDSTDAIKLAIIDKGGDVSGDISTWANAITGISGGGSSSLEEIIFTGTISYNMTEVTITGNLNKIPDIGRNYLVALGRNAGKICSTSHYISDTGPYTLTVDFEEPVSTEYPAICILRISEYNFTVIPVTFNKQLHTDLT